MTHRTLRVTLPHKVDDWPRSRAMALATRCARDLLAKTGEHLAAEPEWCFESREGDTGPLTVAVATVVVDTRADVVKRAQSLMAAMDDQPVCGQCRDYSDLDRLRFDRSLTIPEAAAQLGLSARGYYRHRLIHPLQSNGRPA